MRLKEQEPGGEKAVLGRRKGKAQKSLPSSISLWREEVWKDLGKPQDILERTCMSHREARITGQALQEREENTTTTRE